MSCEVALVPIIQNKLFVEKASNLNWKLEFLAMVSASLHLFISLFFHVRNFYWEPGTAQGFKDKMIRIINIGIVLMK